FSASGSATWSLIPPTALDNCHATETVSASAKNTLIPASSRQFLASEASTGSSNRATVASPTSGSGSSAVHGASLVSTVRTARPSGLRQDGHSPWLDVKTRV